MSNQDDPHETPRIQHERPFLFSWSRRLRHLHGISLRNVDITAASTRQRGKTITDDDAPYNLTTPTKRLRNESQNITQSKSYTDLLAISKDRPQTPQKAVTTYQKEGTPSSRPSIGKLRRRSTLHWSSASPRARQQKLEDVAAPRLADTWFSLHRKDEQLGEPIYISEVMKKSMNPSFAFFDLEATGPLIARSDECVIKVWAKDGRVKQYSFLLELNVNLRSLQYIGKSLENFHHPLPSNCVLFHMSDGIYTSFTDLPGKTYGFSEAVHGRHPAGSVLESGSSFDALMQLANLDECVQDALRIRARLEGEINDMITKTQTRDAGRQKLQDQESQMSASKHAISVLQKQKTQSIRRKEELQQSIKERRDAIKASHDKTAQLKERHATLQTSLDAVLQQEKELGESSAGQIRRIGETLLKIFPIEPIKNKTLQFTIRNLHLPNSVFDDTNRDGIAAALGFTSQLVHQLSLYMSVPLPYPVESSSSFSFIFDPISVGLTQRKYPLHPTNIAYKFEYGVFLLNKDIEYLMSRAGLRILDIRHTLPNLKYLLYVLTAGTGELPARKAGGVRGLFGGRNTPSISRRGSEDSVHSNTDYLKADMADLRRNGSTVPKQTQKEKMLNGEETLWGSPRAVTLPYRHSSLRESD